MCLGCYAEYGAPRIVTAPVLAMAERLRAADHFGGLHIVVDDWNLEDQNVEFCRDHEDSTAEERELAADLLRMTIAERAAAMALADEYLLSSGELASGVADAVAEYDSHG